MTLCPRTPALLHYSSFWDGLKVICSFPVDSSSITTLAIFRIWVSWQESAQTKETSSPARLQRSAPFFPKMTRTHHVCWVPESNNSKLGVRHPRPTIVVDHPSPLAEKFEAAFFYGLCTAAATGADKTVYIDDSRLEIHLVNQAVFRDANCSQLPMALIVDHHFTFWLFVSEKFPMCFPNSVEALYWGLIPDIKLGDDVVDLFTLSAPYLHPLGSLNLHSLVRIVPQGAT